MEAISIDKTAIITSIIKTKIKYLNINYVTREEEQYITQTIQNELLKKNYNVIILDSIDKTLYVVKEIITFKKNIDLNYFINFISLCPNIDIYSVIFDEIFICEKLIELKQIEINKLNNNQPKLARKKEKAKTNTNQI